MNIKIQVIKMLPAVLYGCEIWSLICRRNEKLRVFQGRGAERGTDSCVTGKLHGSSWVQNTRNFGVIESGFMNWGRAYNVHGGGGGIYSYKISVTKP
jgi:hypothetical protein